jgi:hypothetical protein
MMLGAASALLASYLKLRNAPQTAIEQPIEPDVAPVAVAPIVEVTPAEEPVASSEDLETPSEEVTTPPKKEARHRTAAVPHVAEPIEPRDTRRMSEEEDLQQIRDAVLYDRWQERRARRVLRRERLRNERYNHRDLSDLNEIFEGRRRP